MAFYYDWWSGPPGWRHWANQSPFHDPNQVVATGPQYPGGVHRDITATDYPLLGPYDSHTTALIDQHLDWTRRSGIDALISSWWGPGTYEDQSLSLLLNRIDATNSPVRASIYLETWALFYGGQLQPSFFQDPRNFDPNSRAQIRQKAASWIAYLVETYGSRPGLLHVAKGSHQVPVLFVYFAGLFLPAEWQDIFSQVRAKTGQDVYYQGDIEGADLSQLVQIFDGVHVYQPAPFTVQGDASVATRILPPPFGNPSLGAPNPIPGPTDSASIGGDYQAWSHEARALGRSWAATVIPGFDDHNVRNPSFYQSRDHGGQRTYDFYWGEATASIPDWVLITSFNEWHEGSEIEPSVEYGREFLDRTLSRAGRVCPGGPQAAGSATTPSPGASAGRLPNTSAGIVLPILLVLIGFALFSIYAVVRLRSDRGGRGQILLTQPGGIRGAATRSAWSRAVRLTARFWDTGAT
jgi:hypothetical protein